jgi:sulfatase maturation enzyme AslB (radical SAM superfamily)
VRFKNIYFEVAGICNGRCRYCVTGAKNANPGGVMQADTFDATLCNLERLDLIDWR